MPRTVRQERIHRRLRLLGEGPAAFYRDACKLVENTPVLETRAHLLAHALREVESALRQVLSPSDYVPPAECAQCHNRPEKHKSQILAILKAYDFGEDDAVSVSWVKLANRDALSLNGLAHRSRLGEPRDMSGRAEETWAETEVLLDALLDRFESRFAQQWPFLEKLLQKAQPGKQDVKDLLSRVPNNDVTAEYFFARASARWLEPLRNTGVFAMPPSIRRDEDGAERFPVWYPSKYLARLAQSERAGEVLSSIGEIALALAPTTNPWVRYDVAVALQYVPVEFAARLVPFADDWLTSPTPLRLPEQLGLVSLRLLENGKLDEGLALIAALLHMEANPAPGPFREVEIHARYDSFEFTQLLEVMLPRATASAGLRLLRVLCESLEKAVQLTLTGPGSRDDGCAFRPEIEAHRQNRTISDRPLSLLIDAARDTAESLILADPGSVATTVLEFERHKLMVFRRLALYLVHRHPESARADVARYLLAAEDLESVAVWHERRLLERTGFRHLGAEEQTQFLAPIWKGPETVTTTAASGEPLPESELDRQRMQWRVHHLEPVAEFLSGKDRDEYARMLDIVGPPSHPDFLMYIGEVWTGPTSPRNDAELAALTVEEIVDYLTAWVPSGEWMAPSREGVGRTLKQVVAQDPARFVERWHLFKGVHKTYLRALVEGITDAINAKMAVGWPDVLALCAWIVSRPTDGQREDGTAPHRDEDPDWSWTWKSVAWLLRRGMEDGPSSLPAEQHEAAWKVIVPLVEHHDPDDRGWGGAFDQALNTLHGASIHAALAFALWRTRRLRGHSDAAPDGFAAMPNVAAMLEKHLDPRQDPSLATRALYGDLLSQLVAVDEAWVKRHIDLFFPRDEALQAMRDATWTTYIDHAAPYPAMLELVQPELRRAITTLAKTAVSGRERDRLVESLVRHVAGYYWLGLVPLQGGLLDVFYEHADPTARAALMKHIGFSFFHAEAVDPPILQRVIDLWSQRCSVTATYPHPDRQAELEPFGWWFASEKFEATWAIEQLRKLLEEGIHPDADFAVAKVLVKLAASHPLAALDSFSRMLLRDDKDHWRILRCRQEVRDILSVALVSPEPAVASAARDLCNRLVARGHAEFLSLLPPRGPQ